MYLMIRESELCTPDEGKKAMYDQSLKAKRCTLVTVMSVALCPPFCYQVL